MRSGKTCGDAEPGALALDHRVTPAHRSPHRYQHVSRILDIPHGSNSVLKGRRQASEKACSTPAAEAPTAHVALTTTAFVVKPRSPLYRLDPLTALQWPFSICRSISQSITLLIPKNTFIWYYFVYI